MGLQAVAELLQQPRHDLHARLGPCGASAATRFRCPRPVHNSGDSGSRRVVASTSACKSASKVGCFAVLSCALREI
jgi:hypothetical protein